ncbi:MAG: hypothetical protein ACK4WH_14500 [Phycisphaerales bacterium]
MLHAALLLISAMILTSTPAEEFERLWALATDTNPFRDSGHHVRFRMTYEPEGEAPAEVLFEVWKYAGMYRVRQDLIAPSRHTQDWAIDHSGLAWSLSGFEDSGKGLTVFHPGVTAPKGWDFTQMQGQHWSELCAFETQGLSLIRNWPKLPKFQPLPNGKFVALSSIPDAELRIEGSTDPLRITSITQSGIAAKGPFRLVVSGKWHEGSLTGLDYHHHGVTRRRYSLEHLSEIDRRSVRAITTVPENQGDDPVRGRIMLAKKDDSSGHTRIKSISRDGELVVASQTPSGSGLVTSATHRGLILAAFAVASLVLIRLLLNWRRP